MKTLEDFKLLVAKEKGFNHYKHFFLDAASRPNGKLHIIKFNDTVAERYADYKYLHGKAEAALHHVAVDLEKVRTEAWNEAIHWVEENMELDIDMDKGEHYTERVLKESILKGLRK